MTTGTKMTTTGELAGRKRALTVESERGTGGALLRTAGSVARQLAGALAIIVLVWLVVMLFRHLQAVALVLAGVVLAVGGLTLFVRNRSLRG